MIKIENIFHNRLQRWGYTFIINICIIALFCGIGYWIDQQFDSYPKAFLVLLFASFPISLAVQIYLIKKNT